MKKRISDIMTRFRDNLTSLNLNLPVNVTVALDECEEDILLVADQYNNNCDNHISLIHTHTNLLVNHNKLLIDCDKLQKEITRVSELYSKLLEQSQDNIHTETVIEKMKSDTPEKFISLKFDVENDFSLCDLNKFKFDDLN